MNELIKPLSPTERDDVQDLLSRLFVLQDRPAGKEKLEIFLDELVYSNFSYEAIIAGIKDLIRSDLRNIKIYTIKEAIRNKSVVNGFNKKESCSLCAGIGMVTLMNKGHAYSFACKCSNGDTSVENQKFVRWNGKATQKIGEMDYKVHETLAIFMS